MRGEYGVADPLEDIYLRLDRADEQLQGVTEAIQRFLDDKPYEIVGQFYPKTGNYVLRGFVHTPPPKKFSLLAAEVAHALRSSLDNLAQILAKRNSGTPPEGTGFPIFLNPDGYNAISEATGKPSQKSGLYKVRGWHPDAQAVVEGLQPYNRGKERDPLRLIQVIDILDKHKFIEPVAAVPSPSRGVTINELHGVDIRTARIGVRAGTFKNGTVLGVVTLTVTDPSNFVVQMNHNLSFDVAFNPKGPARGAPILATLGNLRDHIRGVVLPALEDFVR
jgi:hypothetical protein